MFPDAPEVLFVTDILADSRYQHFRAPFGSEANFSIRFYAGAVIVVDGFRLGVISVVDTSPRPVLSLCDRQNLLDLAAAISCLTKERRQRQLRLRKERANLMLGLNHNLRTPVFKILMNDLSSLCSDLIFSLLLIADVSYFSYGNASQ